MQKDVLRPIAWMGWEKSQETLVSVSGFRAEIRAWKLQNTKQLKEPQNRDVLMNNMKIDLREADWQVARMQLDRNVSGSS